MYPSLSQVSLVTGLRKRWQEAGKEGGEAIEVYISAKEKGLDFHTHILPSRQTFDEVFDELPLDVCCKKDQSPPNYASSWKKSSWRFAKQVVSGAEMRWEATVTGDSCKVSSFPKQSSRERQVQLNKAVFHPFLLALHLLFPLSLFLGVVG